MSAAAPHPDAAGAAGPSRSVTWVLLAVVPATADPEPEAADVRVVLHRELAALVAPPRLGESAAMRGAVAARHREVQRALERGAVLPAPLGVGFGTEAAVLDFLDAAYAELTGALAYVEGRWEFRLHAEHADPDLAGSVALDVATRVYAELRRFSHAAVPLPTEGKRVLSAAFLVERTGSDAFRDRVRRLSEAHPGVRLDLTGPWPPYDFVQMQPQG